MALRLNGAALTTAQKTIKAAIPGAGRLVLLPHGTADRFVAMVFIPSGTEDGAALLAVSLDRASGRWEARTIGPVQPLPIAIEGSVGPTGAALSFTD